MGSVQACNDMQAQKKKHYIGTQFKINANINFYAFFFNSHKKISLPLLFFQYDSKTIENPK